MTKVDTKLLLDFVKNVATTPKHGERELADPAYAQDWEEGCGKYAIETLHNSIDEARDLLQQLHVP